MKNRNFSQIIVDFGGKMSDNEIMEEKGAVFE